MSTCDRPSNSSGSVLHPPPDQLRQLPRAPLGRERLLLLDGHPGQLPPLFLDPLGVGLELALGREQLLAGRLPLLLRPDLHRTSFVLSSSYANVARTVSSTTNFNASLTAERLGIIAPTVGRGVR